MMKQRCKRAALAAAVVGISFSVLPSLTAQAADRVWSNNAGGAFNLASNWGGFPPPGAADNAWFNLNAPVSYTVTLPSNVTNNKLVIRNDAVDFEMATAATTYTLTSTTTSIVIGDILGSDALFSLYQGKLLAVNSIIGSQAGSSGDALVSGSGASWLNSGTLTVGQGGVGLLAVDSLALVRNAGLTVGNNDIGSVVVDSGASLDSTSYLTIGNGPAGSGDVSVYGGGQLSSASGLLAVAATATGSALIDGPSSQWAISGSLEIGRGGFATVAAQNGGKLTATGVTIGTLASADGQLEVADEGIADLGTSSLVVGQAGAGGLLIDGAGVLTSGNGILADALGSSGNAAVSGAGSQWNASGQLVVGRAGTSSLIVDMGATISSMYAVIGEAASGDGMVLVTGNGSEWTVAGALQVGQAGIASLNIEDGGVIDSISATVGGSLDPADGSGTVTVSGANSLWNVPTQLTVGANGPGYLIVNTGGAVSSGTGQVGAGAGGGVVEINGAGSVWNSYNLYVGGDATGPQGSSEITLLNGGALNATGTLRIWALGKVTLGGGTVIAGLIDLAGGAIAGTGAIASPITNSNGQIIVDTGELALTGEVGNTAGSTLSKLGTGALRIAGPQNHEAGSFLAVHAGSVQFDTDAGSATAANLTVDVNNATTVVFNASQHLAGLNVGNSSPMAGPLSGATASLSGGGEKVLYTQALSIADGSVLDLNNNDLVVQAASGTRDTVLADVVTWIKSARDTTPTQWEGSGITSSAAKLNSLTGLAAVLNDRGDGTPLDSRWDVNAVLAKYTWNGDMNLDGVVNALDYFKIDSGFLAGATGYANGDLNYDGVVNALDYFLIDSAFLGQSGPLSSALAATSVPEPGFGLALVGLAGLLRRVRRG